MKKRIITPLVLLVLIICFYFMPLKYKVKIYLKTKKKIFAKQDKNILALKLLEKLKKLQLNNMTIEKV